MEVDFVDRDHPLGCSGVDTGIGGSEGSDGKGSKGHEMARMRGQLLEQ